VFKIRVRRRLEFPLPLGEQRELAALASDTAAADNKALCGQLGLHKHRAIGFAALLMHGRDR
jgi:hypothetical protein